MINLFIVTYKADDLLERCLDSVGDGVSCVVINNYGKMSFGSKYINNECRPDWSTGHIARSWNQALLFGFKDLLNPAADIVCACQDDTIFADGWVDNLKDIHGKYAFVQQGIGDNFMSWTPDAVKEIGMWDERFNGLAHQEADYLLRAALSDVPVTINDGRTGHERLYNDIGTILLKPAQTGKDMRHKHKGKNEVWKQTKMWLRMNAAWFAKKWGSIEYATAWTEEKLERAERFRSEINLYPYFEKDIKPELYED